jgi:hypothetical protein
LLRETWRDEFAFGLCTADPGAQVVEFSSHWVVG